MTENGTGNLGNARESLALEAHGRSHEKPANRNQGPPNEYNVTQPIAGLGRVHSVGEPGMSAIVY